MPDSLPFAKDRAPEYDKHPPRKPLTEQAPIGAVFGHWTVLEHLPARHGHRYLRCRCVCGQERKLMGGHVVRGKSTNCGCKHPHDGNRKHGMSGTRTHNIWMGMLDRCRRPSHKNYSQYGGRGIEVCDRWQTFENFLADMGEAPEGCSIERQDVNGSYCPENCCWLPQAEQAHNRRDSVLLTLGERTQCLAKWAAELGISQSALRGRYDRGWTHERILTTPVRGGANA